MLEWLDKKMQHWIGRRSVWEKNTAPARYGAKLVLALWILAVSFLWAVSLLSYLLPPIPLWQQLWTFSVPLYPLIFSGRRHAVICD